MNLDYEDSGDGKGEKYASSTVKTYWDGSSKGSLKHLRGATTDYHRDGLKYVVEARLKSCEAWGQSRERKLRYGVSISVVSDPGRAAVSAGKHTGVILGK